MGKVLSFSVLATSVLGRRYRCQGEAWYDKEAMCQGGETGMSVEYARETGRLLHVAEVHGCCGGDGGGLRAQAGGAQVHGYVAAAKRQAGFLRRKISFRAD